MKDVLDLRPVYHRLEPRIRAHVTLCWLALLLIRIAETRTGDTWRTLADELDLLHLGTFTSPTATITRRTAFTAAQRRILAALGVDEPPLLSDVTLATGTTPDADHRPSHPPRRPGRPRHRCRVALARLHEAEDELQEALDLPGEAERVHTTDFFPNARPIPAMRARMQVRGGRMGDALGWAREQGLSPDDDLSHLRESEHITPAMVMLARGRGRLGRDVHRRGDRRSASHAIGGRGGAEDRKHHPEPGAVPPLTA